MVIVKNNKWVKTEIIVFDDSAFGVLIKTTNKETGKTNRVDLSCEAFERMIAIYENGGRN
jgi:hypothetical protein